MFDFMRFNPTLLTSVVAGVTVFMLLSWWAIRDAFNKEFESTNEKVFWVQLAVLVPFLGGIVYILVGRKRGKKLQ
jgi:hypothetical protein